MRKDVPQVPETSDNHDIVPILVFREHIRSLNANEAQISHFEGSGDENLDLLIVVNQSTAYVFTRASRDTDCISFKYATSFGLHEAMWGSRVFLCSAVQVFRGEWRHDGDGVTGWALNILSPDPIQVGLQINGTFRDIRFATHPAADWDTPLLATISKIWSFRFPLAGRLTSPSDKVRIFTVPFLTEIPHSSLDIGEPSWQARQLSRTKQRNYAGIEFPLLQQDLAVFTNSQSSFRISRARVELGRRIEIGNLLGRPAMLASGIELGALTVKIGYKTTHDDLSEIDSIVSQFRRVYPNAEIAVSVGFESHGTTSSLVGVEFENMKEMVLPIDDGWPDGVWEGVLSPASLACALGLTRTSTANNISAVPKISLIQEILQQLKRCLIVVVEQDGHLSQVRSEGVFPPNFTRNYVKIYVQAEWVVASYAGRELRRIFSLQPEARLKGAVTLACELLEAAIWRGEAPAVTTGQFSSALLISYSEEFSNEFRRIGLPVFPRHRIIDGSILPNPASFVLLTERDGDTINQEPIAWLLTYLCGLREMSGEKIDFSESVECKEKVQGPGQSLHNERAVANKVKLRMASKAETPSQ